MFVLSSLAVSFTTRSTTLVGENAFASIALFVFRSHCEHVRTESPYITCFVQVHKTHSTNLKYWLWLAEELMNFYIEILE